MAPEQSGSCRGSASRIPTPSVGQGSSILDEGWDSRRAMSAPIRGRFLSAMTVMFSLLALSNATKFLQSMGSPERSGFVLFGVRFEALAPNLIFGLLFAGILAAYARGIWKMQRWVLPLAIAYAFYVPTNLVLFWYMRSPPDRPIFGIIAYLIVALGGSIGTALYLCAHRDRLQ